MEENQVGDLPRNTIHVSPGAPRGSTQGCQVAAEVPVGLLSVVSRR